MASEKAGPEDPKDVILDSIAEGVFTVDVDWRITSFNRAAEEITGTSRSEAVGRPCWEVFRASVCEGGCLLRKTMETGRGFANQTVFIVDAEGRRVPVGVSTALLRDSAGGIIGGVETFRDLSVVEELRRELAGQQRFGGIISKNAVMRRIFDTLPNIAETTSTVLIEGESGTGKELLVRAVHDLSPRRDKPLVVVNCGALPDTLLESELFGYRAGAFTDARKDKPGRFALAEGGTIFLDEIGDVSSALQVRLLRVLEDGTYEPLGATGPTTADVRIVAATNKDLGGLVSDGVFREDLYYRINVIRITLPPLRERKEDVPLLMEHFVEHFSRLLGREITGVAPEVLDLLMRHDFPGNIRELENIVEHAVVVCRGGLIQVGHLPDALRPQITGGRLPRGMTLKDVEAEYVLQVLQRNAWNQTVTARQLGIHKTTLWRKMKRYGIVTPTGRNEGTHA